MAKATTKKGLRVFANILDKAFQTGKKVEDRFKENMKIVFDDALPKWNYTAIPSNRSN